MKNSKLKKTIYRILATITIVVFLPTGIVFPSSSIEPRNRRIYLIGDIHTHYEIQKQIIKHVRALNEESGVNLVFTEGSFGYLDLSSIDVFRQVSGGQEAIEKVAEKYLNLGKIAADEYLRIVDGSKYEIYGIDDMTLYEKMAAYFSGRRPDQTEEESLKVNSKREKAMLDNLFHEMSRRNERSAVMTTGTFHVKRMASELRKRGFEVVMPPMQYNDQFDKDRYKEILERNKRIKIHREEGLKLTAVTERVEWQELPGESLETAIENAYGSVGAAG